MARRLSRKYVVYRHGMYQKHSTKVVFRSGYQELMAYAVVRRHMWILDPRYLDGSQRERIVMFVANLQSSGITDYPAVVLPATNRLTY